MRLAGFDKTLILMCIAIPTCIITPIAYSVDIQGNYIDMGTKDKVAKVGQKGKFVVKATGGLVMVVEVEIVDYKNSYGNDRWLVKPVAGKGQVWTEQNVIEN